MTSCKPPPTCIDASPIPDANDSRMSAIPYEANLTPMGFSPPPERSVTPRSRSLGRKTPPTWPPAPERATLVIVHPLQNANRGALTGPALAPNPPHLDV